MRLVARDDIIKPPRAIPYALRRAEDVVETLEYRHGPAISQREIRGLNHGSRSRREIGSSPGMTNSGQSGVSVAATVGQISTLCLCASVVRILAFQQTHPGHRRESPTPIRGTFTNRPRLSGCQGSQEIPTP
jgi:hypothetical protein